MIVYVLISGANGLNKEFLILIQNVVATAHSVYCDDVASNRSVLVLPERHNKADMT